MSGWRLAVIAVLLLATSDRSSGAEKTPAVTAAERGYRVLRTKQLLPPDFDQQVFDELWKLWPAMQRDEARQASPAERRRLTFSYYGLMEPPDGAGSGPAIGYVDDGQGGWVMSCFACHAGKVAGRVVPGLPNSHYALQTLTEDVRLTKARLLKPFSHMDLGSLKLPLSATNGTTNSVVFGIVLGAVRDEEMRVDRSRAMPRLVHHDMDAPPWWNVKKKSHLYCDAFAPKNHRVLMQFMLLPSNGRETVLGWEEDFRDVLAYIESLEPPPYPWDVDRELAARGEAVFNRACANCHGTYGPGGKYPQKVIPLDVVGSDPLRIEALAPEHRQWLQKSWMSRYGEDRVEIEPQGYLAPPLDGIWATAPYLHNGSVPTLWHVLHPDDRPAVWKRTEDGYDRERIGLEVGTFERLPSDVTSAAERRRYFDTAQPGKSASGHRFPDVLGEDEKRAVLEYLKAL